MMLSPPPPPNLDVPPENTPLFPVNSMLTETALPKVIGIVRFRNKQPAPLGRKHENVFPAIVVTARPVNMLPSPSSPKLNASVPARRGPSVNSKRLAVDENKILAPALGPLAFADMLKRPSTFSIKPFRE